MAQPAFSPAPAAAASIHVLRIALADIKPPLWRKLAVPSALTLAELHEVIQIAFGWHNGHLHQFIIADRSAGKHGEVYAADPVFGLDEGKNSHELRLDQVCPRMKSKLLYQYDLGDDWMHEIEVVAIEPRKPGTVYPACLDGERNGPMEDCGGAGGHMELAEAIANPQDADPDMLEWAEDYDPEAFSRREINDVLRDWSIERDRQIGDGIAWRRSSLLWDLATFPKEHLGPRRAPAKAQAAKPPAAGKIGGGKK